MEPAAVHRSHRAPLLPRLWKARPYRARRARSTVCGAANVAAALAASSALAAPLLPVLPQSALPGLASSTRAVTPPDLASDVAGGAPFQRRLVSWGFARGRERDFQGESQTIDRAVSRTLEFRTTAGARAYVRFLGSHAASLYGVGSSARPLESRGRSGYLVTAAACACHRAEPTLLALLTRVRRVTWLEVNGGAATPATVVRLVAQAP